MAGIYNVSSLGNLNNKRVSSKLSFEIGQTFSARVVGSDEGNKELLLKLLDGWQFAAKIEKSLEMIPQGLIRFIVEGFEDGKLQIKVLDPKVLKEEADNNSIESLMEETKLNIGKEDYDILQKMIKFGMPLTKENISRVKTIMDFKEKIAKDDGEEDKFVFKYIKSKGIEENSPEAKEIETALKGFFKELKSLSSEEVLTFIENDIELNEENIKSFNNIIKKDGTIFKEVMDIKQDLKEDKNFTVNDRQSEDLKSPEKTESIQGAEESNIEFIHKEKASAVSKDTDEHVPFNIKDAVQEFNEELEGILTKEDTLKDTKEDELKLKDKVYNKKDIESKDIEPKDIESNNLDNNKTDKPMVLKNGKMVVINKDKDVSELLKEQIKLKSEEMKSVIKGLIESKTDIKPEAYEKILENLKSNINDFKVFNSISNQYYYLDLPINMKNQEYQCKLFIKDDRKSGKKIDSTDIKFVVTVKTANIGTVNAFIKVKNYSMNIDMKCDEDNFMKILNLGKTKILGELESMGFTVHLNIEKKVEEANLVNCRDFFGDKNLGTINTKV